MSSRVTRGIQIAVAAALAGFTLTLAFASPARAASEIAEFKALIANQDGGSATAAGAHPDELITDTQFEVVPHPLGIPVAKGGSPKEISIDLPAGVTGNPLATPRCRLPEMMDSGTLQCPASTQIGLIHLTLDGAPSVNQLYNMVPPKGVAAQLGFNIVGVATFLNTTIRTGSDYGITVTSSNITQAKSLTGVKVVTWGHPASPVHDSDRNRCLLPTNPDDLCPSDAPPVPLLSNPTDCSAGSLGFTARTSSWSVPDVFAVAPVTSDANGNPFRYEECDRVPFDASMKVGGVSSAAGSPSGLEVELKIDQTGMLNPGGVAPSPLKRAEVTLPEGMALNTSSATGLSGCSPAQIALKRAGAARCPESAKIGEVEVESPAVEGILPGDVYVATQGDNPFNSLVALYIAIDDPESGIVVKLPGRIDLDQSTGRLTASFDDNPQLPVERLRLRLKSGPRAPLTTPRSCGTYAIRTELSSWVRPNVPVVEHSSFTVAENCAASGQFKPGFEAGTANPAAGKYSPFLLRVTRGDAEQNLARIEARLPEGALAKLAGVPLCPEAAAAGGSCPVSSQVGSATVGTGSGSSPLYVPQPGRPAPAVFLAGPYKGAPYSLVARIPAQAGPFDLGTVVVRNTISVDPVTTRVSVASDPLPQILQGIPISYRDVRVDVDRPEFTLNPTGCEAKAVQASLGSDAGGVAAVSSHFQAVGCARLGFKPKLDLRLSKGARRAHPKLKATLTMPRGGANVARAQVTMPKAQFLENAHIRTICTRVQYAAEACPKASVYGYARAWSPLLDRPLEGPVYLRSSNNRLPDLVASLDGQIHVDLSGRITSPKGRIRTTFDLVPDAPVSKFVLTMEGGKKGLLVNSVDLCGAKQRAGVQFDGQNGKVADSSPVAKVRGCKAKPKQ